MSHSPCQENLPDKRFTESILSFFSQLVLTVKGLGSTDTGLQLGIVANLQTEFLFETAVLSGPDTLRLFSGTQNYWGNYSGR